MVEGSMKCIKYLTFFFNFLFWLSGLALIIVGAIIRDKYGSYFSYAVKGDDHKFTSVPIFIIVVGVIVFVIGFLGCCGAAKENYCMMTTFAILLALIFILEIVAGALGFAYKKQVKAVAEKALTRAVENYKKEEGAKKFLDFVQQKIECCGKAGAADYDTAKTATCGAGKGVASCHKGDTCTGRPYTKGCKDGIEDFVRKNLVLIGGLCIGVAVIEILGIIFACCLMKAIKSEYEVV